MTDIWKMLIGLGMILSIVLMLILAFTGLFLGSYLDTYLIPIWKKKSTIKKEIVESELENERDRKKQLADHELYLETRKRIEQYIAEDRHLREFIKHYAYWKETYEKDYYQNVIEKDLAYIRHKYEYDKNIFITELTQDILYFYDLVVKIEEEEK